MVVACFMRLSCLRVPGPSSTIRRDLPARVRVAHQQRTSWQDTMSYPSFGAEISGLRSRYDTMRPIWSGQA